MMKYAVRFTLMWSLVAAWAAATAAPANADDAKVDRLIELLVNKGVISREEGRELRQQVEQPHPQAKPKPVKFTAQYRLRGEVRDNRDVNSAVNDSTAIALQRIRLQAEYKPSERLRALVQLQDSRAWGTEASTASNEMNIDLHQGFVEYAAPERGLLARVGRQKLSYGDQRLVGGFEWSNIARSFDALFVRRLHRYGTLDIWAAQTKENDVGLLATGAPRADGSEIFYGAYNQWQPRPGLALDAYLLRRDADTGADHWTLGFRGVRSPVPEQVDYALEAAYQFGHQGAADFRAHAAVGSVGYTWPVKYSPRLFVRYAMASGDPTPGAGDVETFDQLFPTNHLHYGYADMVGWRNMHNLQVGLQVKPNARTKLGLDWHTFRLDEPADAWYNAGGGIVLQDATGGSGDDIGSEIDLTLWYTAAPGQKYGLGLSRFFTGSFAANAGPAADDSTWLFLQSLYDF